MNTCIFLSKKSIEMWSYERKIRKIFMSNANICYITVYSWSYERKIRKIFKSYEILRS